jgi:hypothetical protein
MRPVLGNSVRRFRRLAAPGVKGLRPSRRQGSAPAGTDRGGLPRFRRCAAATPLRRPAGGRSPSAPIALAFATPRLAAGQGRSAALRQMTEGESNDRSRGVKEPDGNDRGGVGSAETQFSRNRAGRSERFTTASRDCSRLALRPSLAVRSRRAECRYHGHPDRHGEDEPRRSARLASRRPGAHRRASFSPDRRVLALMVWTLLALSMKHDVRSIYQDRNSGSVA